MMNNTLRQFRIIAIIAALFLCAPIFAQETTTTVPESGPVYEIRNYHFEPSLISEYEAWARDEALPYIRENLDVVGFWVYSGIDAEVGGAPLDEMGSANVTWIIRWNSKAERDEQMKKVFSGPVWDEIFAKVPGGGKSYLRVESKFFKGL